MSEKNTQELVITRTFNAPRDMVWKAWSEADQLAQWWGPKGFAMEVTKFEFKPGGMFLYNMQPPNAGKIWGRFLFREMVAPEKLVFINSFSDENGGITQNPWLPVWPKEILNTMTLKEQDGKTTITISGGPINASPEELKAFEEGQSSMEEGFKGTWEKLDELLAKQSK